MSPEQAIAALDRALQSTGEDVVLRRILQHQGRKSSHHDVNIRAMVRGSASYDFAGGIQLDQGSIIISPTEVVNNQWCWPIKKRDLIIFDNRPRVVEDVTTVKVAGVIVRYDVEVEEVGSGTLQS